MRKEVSTDSSESIDAVANERGRLEYLLGLREGEIIRLKNELSAEHEINSLCASFLMYLMIKFSQNNSDEAVFCAPKSEVNEFVGKYHAVCDDVGGKYKVRLLKRDENNVGEESK